MDKSWRPENWNNLYSSAYKSCIDTAPEFAIQAGMQGLAYEAGADAMLETLKSHTIINQNGIAGASDSYCFILPVGFKGTMTGGKWVFIPNDEVKDG
jgi:hypothetical protein